MAETAVSFRVTGRVQGVWFRGWAQGEAERLRLRGWVRNEDDGSVTGVVAGPEARVAEMVAALGRGPELARVDAVDTRPAEMPPGDGFRIAR